MFKSIVLFTNNLKSLMLFYGNVLELDISKASDEQFTIKVGNLLLRLFNLTVGVLSYCAQHTG